MRRSNLTVALGAATALVFAGALTGTAAAQDVAAHDSPVVVSLQGVNGAGGSGVAQIDEVDGQAQLTLELQDVPAEAELTIVVVAGTCAAPGEVRSALGSVHAGEDGAAHEALALAEAVEALLAAPATIQVLAAGEEGQAPVLCGEIAPEPEPADEN